MSKHNPLISICIPMHNMENANFFAKRVSDSILAQTYTNYEVVVTRDGKMAENTNSAIKQAKGDIIKILYMDDYLRPHALQNIADNFTGGWYASGCEHTENDQYTINPHLPSFFPGIVNTIGSPSVLAFENKDPLLFDENLSWTLDIELYNRLYKRYGAPTLQMTYDVVIGLHKGQMTNIMSNEEKKKEEDYLLEKLHG